MVPPNPSPAPLPTGTVTFLFTDVVGSTRLWERHPEATRRSLARHDSLIEQLADAHHGHVVRPRGEGDSRFCVFPRASDAVQAAAAAIQYALHQEPWPVETPISIRIALHTGEADFRDGDYYGSAVNRAARLRGIAHGGQILLSGATAALARPALSPGLTLRDLGQQRLRDLGEPEHVHQLLADGLLDSFPALLSLDSLPNNLPVQLTSFIGREDALSEVKQLLSGARLLTLSGTGGSGKTRLALQAAAEVVEDFPGGVWFIDLAPLADASLVATTALAALGAIGADDMSGVPAETRLVEFLRAKHALLVLDNCEHVIEACARLVDTLLRQCPGIRVMATSRELLGVRGETAWRVPSLTSPDPTAAQLDQYEAVRLFIDRALAVQPTFQVTNQNAPAVAQICHRLDGIPLAIELAAARVRVLSVEQIAARLNDRFRLLTGGGRTALRRQQTLQALVDWSHDLLSDPERALFRRLAVFAGGFILEAAETVCSGEPVESYEVLDLLTGLVDKSLVLAETRGAAERYRLLETMRQYAEDKLLQAGEAASVRDRHVEWCISLVDAAKAANQAANSAGLRAAIQAHRAETDNVRAALTWCASSPDAAPAGLRLLGHMSLGAGLRLDSGETGSEARRWLETFLRLVPVRSADRAECLLTLDHHLRWHHEFTLAGAAAREAREIFQEIGDADRARMASVHEGLVAANLGDYERAVALIEAALVEARARDDWQSAEQFTRDLGVIAIASRHFVAARTWIEQTLALSQRRGLPGNAAHGHLRLAMIERLDGNLRASQSHLDEASRLLPGLSSVLGGSEQLGLAAGNRARAEGRLDDARTLIHGALRSIRQRGAGEYLLSATAMAGMLEIAAGDHARGVTIIAACATGEGPIGIIHIPDVRAEAPLFLDQARAGLGESTYDAAWTKGRSLTLDQAVRLALAEPPSRVEHLASANNPLADVGQRRPLPHRRQQRPRSLTDLFRKYLTCFNRRIL